VASALVLVNGLPGSGKTTLASGLTGPLGAVLLSKDAVKEALAELLPDPVAVPALGAVAMGTAWNLAARHPGAIILESWWFRPRDLQIAEASLRSLGTVPAVEIWCDVAADIARIRYATRVRGALYDDARHLVDDWDDWAARAAPLALTPVLTIDTRRPVDIEQLARAVRERLALA
jgi:predicted kinase